VNLDPLWWIVIVLAIVTGVVALVVLREIDRRG
jgi:hypothetical protein